nr:hypothetical protein CoNPh37_CDS0112 [Staphylococcus phage S-CoN_Ph37]
MLVKLTTRRCHERDTKLSKITVSQFTLLL